MRDAVVVRIVDGCPGYVVGAVVRVPRMEAERLIRLRVAVPFIRQRVVETMVAAPAPERAVTR